MSWCFGFIENKKKELILSEIYFKKDKPFMYLPVTKKDLKTFKKDEDSLILLIDDVTGALSKPLVFREDEIY